MKRALVVLLTCFWATAAWGHEISCPTGGAEGVKVAATAGTRDTAGKIPSGAFEIYANWMVCNRDTGAAADFDTTSRQGGAADQYIVSLEDLNTCTAVDVTIGFRNDATGVNHTVGTLSLGTTSLVITGPRPRYVTATVNASTGCTASEVDVRLDSYYRRTSGP